MKKKIFILILFITSLFIINTTKVNAVGTANISIWASAGTVVSGNNVTFTVDLTSSNNGAFSAWSYTMQCGGNLIWQSGDKINELAGASSSPITSKRFTFNFKTTGSGTATCTFKLHSLPDYNDSASAEMGGTKEKSASIRIITQSELEASYSKNNNLSSLSVEGYTLSPNFNKNTLEYNVELPNGVTKIKINGSKEDGTASINGLGEHNVSEGKNRIEIKVTAQNGSVKTYIINATVKELDPIVVQVNGEEYNVIRKKDQISAPNDTYTEKTILINELEVPAYENTKIGYVLVGLKDKEGNINLYIYDEKANTYTLYQEFTFSSSIIYIKDNPTKIPDNYKPANITINDKKVTAYHLKASSRFYLFYGVNVTTGEENLYSYDSKEGTVQRYNDEVTKELIKENNEKEKIYQYVVIGLGSLLILTYLILLISLIINSNKKRKHLVQKMSIVEEVKINDTPKKKNKRKETKEKEENIEETSEKEKDD